MADLPTTMRQAELVCPECGGQVRLWDDLNDDQWGTHPTALLYCCSSCWREFESLGELEAVG